LDKFKRYYLNILPLTGILSLIEVLKRKVKNFKKKTKILLQLKNLLDLRWLKDLRLQQCLFSDLIIRTLTKLPVLIFLYSNNYSLKFFQPETYYNFLSFLLFTKRSKPFVLFLNHLCLIGQSSKVSNVVRRFYHDKITFKMKSLKYFFEQSLHHIGLNQFLDNFITDISFWLEGGGKRGFYLLKSERLLFLTKLYPINAWKKYKKRMLKLFWEKCILSHVFRLKVLEYMFYFLKASFSFQKRNILDVMFKEIVNLWSKKTFIIQKNIGRQYYLSKFLIFWLNVYKKKHFDLNIPGIKILLKGIHNRLTESNLLIQKAAMKVKFYKLINSFVKDINLKY